jgi:hypothetical protein
VLNEILTHLSLTNLQNRYCDFYCVEVGTFLVAKTIHIGEALALHHALEWLNDMFDNVDFTSDSKAIDEAFHHAQVDVT